MKEWPGLTFMMSSAGKASRIASRSAAVFQKTAAWVLTGGVSAVDIAARPTVRRTIRVETEHLGNMGPPWDLGRICSV